MKQYLDFLQHILDVGERNEEDRTGTGTIRTFGYQMRFDLQKGFPLLTTKRVYTKGVLHELLWFLQGNTNVQYLQENKVHIWDGWADKNGDLGPIYGKQWREWRSCDENGNIVFIDQIKTLIENICKDPFSRRHVVSAWNVGQLNEMALPPCHLLFQFFVSKDLKLSCQLYQRSADAFLGVPFNIASYSLLTHMIAQVCGLDVGEFVWVGGDCHIYLNHLDAVETQLSRTPNETLPTLRLDPTIKDIDGFCAENISFENYSPQSTIKAPISL